ncbi:hypothetical protein PILCRDRAFT_818588 [Piloderma croceum F 1598]|uniref:Uncharacterized protein n=1 Tax=Piloderma croceum (strain F 1598) TaxID=765440 RepID=A0A0C3G0P7_PILCF|nr:hypothetical protein PILCRDRAFT_818588 [Piloderma croceum F 1598]
MTKKTSTTRSRVSEGIFVYAGVGITPKRQMRWFAARHLCRRNKRGTHTLLTLPPDHNFPRKLEARSRCYAEEPRADSVCSPLGQLQFRHWVTLFASATTSSSTCFHHD